MKHFWNKTKVICTIGPACASRDTLKKMILSGMDIARFNFSHGTPAEHLVKIKTIKTLAEDYSLPVATLQDLPGPKIRLGPLEKDFITLKEGQKFSLINKKTLGSLKAVYVTNPVFLRSLKKNYLVYLNDGLVTLKVTGVYPDKVDTEVIIGGKIYAGKGVNCPGRFLGMSAVTKDDLKCLEFGIKAGVDFVAISFVQTAQDILKVKNFLRKKNKNTLLVAKIERKAAFEDIDNIIDASDAVMVARGDLGIEAQLEELPFLQKELIKKCNNKGKPVITATQMLESMVNSIQPTRAEVTDIANAILDGTDALMLSEETAIGKYPLQTLKTMVSIAEKTEGKLSDFIKKHAFAVEDNAVLSQLLSNSAVEVANKIKAKAIIAPTKNSDVISELSRLRPFSPVIGITSDKNVYRKSIILWGVIPVLIKKFRDLSGTLRGCVKLACSKRLLKRGDNAVLILTSDNRLFASNIMEVLKVGR